MKVSTRHPMQQTQPSTSTTSAYPENRPGGAACADLRPASSKEKLTRCPGFFLGVLLVGAAASANAQITWYSGQRVFGQVTIEPAVDYATGNEIFLLTPNHGPFPSKAAQRAHAPMYLVMYPETSAVEASTLNCQPTNCDHVQTYSPYGVALKGHDHLVGMPHTGDFNVAWDVYLMAFTPQGFADGAINTRILTLDQLNAALASGDIVQIGPEETFNCSITSAATYLHGTALSFPSP